MTAPYETYKADGITIIIRRDPKTLAKARKFLDGLAVEFALASDGKPSTCGCGDCEMARETLREHSPVLASTRPAGGQGGETQPEGVEATLAAMVKEGLITDHGDSYSLTDAGVEEAVRLVDTNPAAAAMLRELMQRDECKAAEEKRPSTRPAGGQGGGATGGAVLKAPVNDDSPQPPPQPAERAPLGAVEHAESMAAITGAKKGAERCPPCPRCGVAMYRDGAAWICPRCFESRPAKPKPTEAPP